MYHTMGKTEIVLDGIHLNKANLDEISSLLAKVIGLKSEEVFIVNVLPGQVTVDLVCTIIPDGMVGKKDELKDLLSNLDSIKIDDNFNISSRGILGHLSLPMENYNVSIEAEMSRQLDESIRRRVTVFPTGFEVIQGMIQDTNTPFLLQTLNDNGFLAESGSPLADDPDIITGKLRLELEKAKGWIITTGGIGGEMKDLVIPAMELLALEKNIAPIVCFQHSFGSAAVRIFVGRVDHTFLVALPGPHVEVRACIDILLSYMKREHIDMNQLAEDLAESVRQRWTHLKNKG
jgi:molybdopterin biosynthesis enzyme MoaB